jgi:parallel beta-helix repeat protein
MQHSKLNRHFAEAVRFLGALLLSLGLLTACGGDSNNDDDAGSSPGPTSPSTTQFRICQQAGSTPQSVQDAALVAFFDAREGDTIEFCEGTYSFTTGLFLHSKRGITIKGAGKDKTFLNFNESASSEGINVASSDGIVIQGLTVEDTPGNAIRIFRSNFVTLRDVRTRWSDADPSTPAFDTSPNKGAYGLYPVECRYVLIEDSEAIGASDAGIYVGQTSDVIVRRTRAEYNVAGFEFENTYRAVFEDNIATNNTGGFLVFDLPGLRQYGQKNIVRRNKSFGNNTENFAPIGNIVGVVPRGTGMLVLATDQLEIYENEVTDNDTVGLAIVNFGLAAPDEPDIKYDFYPEGLYVHSNLFRDNGGNPQMPSQERGEASVLPLLLRLKNGGRGAHIVWDGGVDEPNDCTAIPKDPDGVPLTQPNPRYPHEEQGGRIDERGRPNISREDTVGSCKWNAWKFASQSVQDANRLCIADNNRFENTSPQTLLTTDYLNAKLTSSDPERLVLDLATPASTDLAPHRCTLTWPVPPAGMPSTDADLKLPFVPDASSDDARPSPAEVAAACVAPSGNAVNYAALLKYNCPQLQQYGLFSNPQDPRSAPNGGGVPFELNSALFSDYATKYRVLYLPPGGKATYQDRTTRGVTATLDLPVGSVIAKTFAFRTDTAGGFTEDVVETRLLIKRSTSRGVVWVGLPYVWEKNAQGALDKAVLRVQGADYAASYDYLDPDPEVRDGSGARAHYVGSVSRYNVPAAMTCISCHGGDDREAGAAPIGMKPRYLNRSNSYGGVQKNQLQHLADLGLLQDLPANLATVEKHPRWNVPGDTGQTPDSPEDIHQRVRAYLEVNCMHCHNSGGNASNSGLFLDAFRTVNVQYGICKEPVAAGRGSGNRSYDIVPGSAADSILNFRVNSAEAGIRMPPLARSVVHGEAAALMVDWVDNVLPTPDTEDEEVCSGLLPGLPSLPVGVPSMTAPPGQDPITQLVSTLQSLASLSSADQRRESRLP